MSWQIYDFGASGTTLIDGANIYTGSILGTSIKANEITGNHIKAGAIATSHLAFSLVGSDNVVATINASTEGIKINAAKLTLTGLLQVGGAAADINAGATTIDGGKITADSLDATKIKAASITTDKLAVGTVQRDNLLTNGHFGTYNTYGDNYRGWSLDGGTFVPANGSYYPGGTTTDLWVPRINASVTNSLQLLSQRVTVVPGRTYTLAGMLYHTAGRAGIRVWAVGGNELSNTWSAGVSAGTNVPVFYQNATLISNGQASSDVANRWNLYAYRVTIPNGVTQVDIQICAWLTGDVNVYPGFIQFYDDDINEATGSMDLVNQMKNVAFGGDIQGNYTSIAVRGLQGRLVSSAAPSHAHVLGWHSTNNQWQPLSIDSWLGYTPYQQGTALIATTGTFTSNGQGDNLTIGDDIKLGDVNLVNTLGLRGVQNSTAAFIKFGSGGPTFGYDGSTNLTASGAISATQFNGSGAGLTGTAGSLSVNYASSAGNADTLDGRHFTDIPTDTTTDGYKMDWSTRAPRSGFYEADTGTKTNLPTGTGTGGYMHIINCQHSNGGNNFALQIAAGFGPGGGSGEYSDLFWRVTNNDGTRAWRTIWDTGNFNPADKANINSPSFIGNIQAYRLISNAGNLHLDANGGSNGVYIGYYSGTGGMRVGNGAQVVKWSVTGNGYVESWYPGSALVAAGGTAQHGGIHFNAHSDNMMVGFTSAATSSGTQGGVLIQGSGFYGTSIRFLTTDSYAQGAKLSMTLDPSGNLTLERGGTVFAKTFETQPNASWGGVLELGGNGGGTGSATRGRVQVTDGNLHLDAGNGKTLYLNYYNSGGAVYVKGDTNMSGAASAWGYRGNANVSGTGNASYHPDGLYAAGANSWLYGNININNSICDSNGNGRMQLKASGELYSSPNGTASDPYGCHSVTNPANSNNYGYYGMTRAGYIGWMLGITTNNEFVVGTGTGNGSQSIITSGALYVNTGGKVTAGTGFCIMDGNTALTRGISYATRITTPSGWVDIGPQNTSWCHFSTDRAGFYFGSRVEINGDLCRYSNQNWWLRDRGTGGTLRLKDTTNGFFYELYVENGVLKLIQV